MKNLKKIEIYFLAAKRPDTFNGSIKEVDELGNEERQPSPGSYLFTFVCLLFCLLICLHFLFTFFLPDADGEEEVIVSPKLSVPIDQESRKDSLFDQNVGPPLDPTQLRNYKTIEQILLRMNR